ncbi:hypothetical protein, partial [Paenibacillus hemerocallicola]|uniref:hypothetical protein n=1 Tax=Paenibacillus hemerocallicola TaxID=1172614 RepID=UPI001C40558B
SSLPLFARFLNNLAPLCGVILFGRVTLPAFSLHGLPLAATRPENDRNVTTTQWIRLQGSCHAGHTETA